jgi:DNA-binding NarL/FixJ family response regulator
LRVVIVDDDDAYRAFLRIACSLRDDIELVGEAANGRDAVALAVDIDPDAVLLDVEMPLLDGFEAAIAIRRACPASRLVLHTADLLDERRRRADELGLVLLDKLDVENALTLLTEPVAAP